MKTPHERSVGARMERKALRAYLRRRHKITTAKTIFAEGARYAWEEALTFIDKRRARYDQRPGGLGRR